MMRIRKYSHHFVIINPDYQVENVIKEFAAKFLLETVWYRFRGQLRQSSKKIYGVRTLTPLEYRFHVNHLEQFLDFATSKKIHGWHIEEIPLYEPVKVEFELVTDKKPRDLQPDIIDYLCSPGFKKVVELQAGGGKTLTSLFAVHRLGVRTALDIKPMYIQRWLDDLTKSTGIFNMSNKEICVIRGAESLANIINMALHDKLEYKFIVFSNATLRQYYNDYIDNPTKLDKYHGVAPHELYPLLKVGLRITDEAHQDFHNCFRADLFTHCPKTISLSATLEPDGEFLKSMYRVVYPKELRFGGGVYKKYVDVVAVPFRLDPKLREVKTTQRGLDMYSHNMLEESIMSTKKRLNAYLSMIEELTQRYFISKRYSDHRLLIFARRVDMCQTIADHLKTKYPKLVISKYTEEESYEILDSCDIIVSTPISAGTAVDISKLQVCINTVALGSTQANLQMIGRLRELRQAPVNPLFVYLYCEDIPKHVEYHNKKMNKTFAGKVLSYNILSPSTYMV